MVLYEDFIKFVEEKTSRLKGSFTNLTKFDKFRELGYIVETFFNSEEYQNDINIS